MIIAVDGIVGSGRSSVCKETLKLLQAKSIPSKLTSIPSEGPVGHLLQQVVRRELVLEPKALLGLWAADLWWNDQHVVRPAQETKQIVLIDGYCYQVWAAQAELWEGRFIPDFLRGLVIPDLVFILDVRPEIASTRSGLAHDQTSIHKWFRNLVLLGDWGMKLGNEVPAILNSENNSIMEIAHYIAGQVS